MAAPRGTGEQARGFVGSLVEPLSDVTIFTRRGLSVRCAPAPGMRVSHSSTRPSRRTRRVNYAVSTATACVRSRGTQTVMR